MEEEELIKIGKLNLVSLCPYCQHFCLIWFASSVKHA